MSNFIKQTKHPVTGEWEEASWLDDFFGKHIYGVQFIKDAVVYNADEIKFETRETSVKTTPQEEMEKFLVEKSILLGKYLGCNEEELYNELKPIATFISRQSRQEVLREVREKIGELVIKKPSNKPETHIAIKRGAYNKALTDLLSTLESKE